MPLALETMISGSHINLANETDVAFWCEKLEVSPSILHSAVRAVGGSARFVHLYIEGARQHDA